VISLHHKPLLPHSSQSLCCRDGKTPLQLAVDSRSKNKSEVVSFLCGTSPIQRSFQANSVVIARGLVARSDLNGKRCVITGSFSEASGRWPVRFVDSGEEKYIKDENIVGEDAHES
jgi:hypothetical protein